MVEFGRLLTAMITPFNADGTINFPQARKLAQSLVSSGTEGLVIGGTTGEAPSMSDDEKISNNTYNNPWNPDKPKPNSSSVYDMSQGGYY